MSGSLFSGLARNLLPLILLTPTNLAAHAMQRALPQQPATSPPSQALIPAELPAQLPPGQIIPAGQLDVARMVDLVSDQLKVPIRYEPGVLRGEVTFRSPTGIAEADLWNALNASLASAGFTTIRSELPGEFQVVRLAEAPAITLIEVDPLDPTLDIPIVKGLPLIPGFRSVQVKVSHRTLASAAGALGELLGKGFGTITIAPNAQVLVISDLEPRIQRALTLLKHIDNPDSTTAIVEVQLKNTSSKSVLDYVAKITGAPDAASGGQSSGQVVASSSDSHVAIIAPKNRVAYWQSVIDSIDTREAVQTVVYTPRAFRAAEVAGLLTETIGDTTAESEGRWRVTVDALTGSLIVRGTSINHEKVREVLERLDATPQSARRSIRTFIVKNRNPEDLLAVVQKLVTSGYTDTFPLGLNPADPAHHDRNDARKPWPPRTTDTASAAQDALSADPSRDPTQANHESANNESIRLSVDTTTNTIIAIGEPALLDQVQALITQLDVRQPQVMLEFLVLTISDAQSRSLGVELEQLGASDNVRTRISSLFGIGTRGAGGDRNAGDLSGITGVVLSPGEYSIILRAIESVNGGRSLTTPRLLVTNNKQGSLNSVLEQPFASTNASSTVTTTSFGGSLQAGTQVTVTPQITQADHITLDYQISLSNFAGDPPASTLPPPRQQNELSSTAYLPDGHTVVVGGLEVQSQSDSESRVPVLGSIPILGEAFKSRAASSTRNRFFVFIKASVARDDHFDELRVATQRDLRAGGLPDDAPPPQPAVIP